MRIAIPVKSDQVCSTLSSCEAIHFYEDDHGKVNKSYLAPMAAQRTDAAIALLEKNSADVLVCDTLPDEELREVMLSGIMFSLGYGGAADAAVLAYLKKAVVFDPNNTCNACGHGHACSMNCDSCAVKLD